MTDERLMSRRDVLAAAGALGLVAIGCGDEGGDSTGATPTPAATDGAEATATARPADCVLTPEQTEGPYYLADSLIRSDVTEGKDGAPLELRLGVQDAGSCEPIEGATVEIWHCDALGVYSGVGASGGDDTSLRGGQRTDAGGEVVFRTLYPGWYQGRAPHIHVKVHVGGREVHTGQLYFDEAISAAVYRTAPYAERGEASTTNASDNLYGSGGRQSTLALSRRGDGWTGRLAMGVRT
jgi:protocatechuate 3,4-dioxygenase beta subunit